MSAEGTVNQWLENTKRFTSEQISKEIREHLISGGKIMTDLVIKLETSCEAYEYANMQLEEHYRRTVDQIRLELQGVLEILENRSFFFD